MERARIKGFAAMGLLLAFSLVACHKEESAVAGAAENAVQAEHKAQAAASEQDRQRAALDRIPLPTKSLYENVQAASAWANPFLSVNADSLTLRTAQPAANTGAIGTGSAQQSAAISRQQIPLRPGSLAQALVALPPAAWPYGRVLAVAESPQAGKKDRPRLRRNLEAVIQQLNDLGIVVQEWPAR